jgi:hypothetical protein
VRRRWPFAVGAAAVVAGGVAAIVIASSGEPATKRLVTGPDDPWSGEGPAHPVVPEIDAGADDEPPLELVERNAMREAMSDSLRYHAPDVQGLLAVSIAEMRRTPEVARLFAGMRKQSMVRGIIESLIGECDLPFGDRADWLTISLHEEFGVYDLVANGNWTREEIEECLRGTDGTVERRGNENKLSVIAAGTRPRVVGWIDGRTFFTSNRATADAAFVTARLARAPAKPNRVLELAAGIDRRASLWMIGDARSLGRVDLQPELKGADMSARLALGERDEDGKAAASFEVAFYFPDEERAKTGETAVKTGLAGIVEHPLFDLAMPAWTIRRDGTMVRVHGMIPDDLLDRLQDVGVDYLP